MSKIQAAYERINKMLFQTLVYKSGFEHLKFMKTLRRYSWHLPLGPFSSSNDQPILDSHVEVYLTFDQPYSAEDLMLPFRLGSPIMFGKMC